MAALPPRPERRRPRHGSAERPVNSRSYRGTWLLVGIPFLVAAFSVGRPEALPRTPLPPAFDAGRARQLADEVASVFPDRRPGTRGGARAAGWVAAQFRREGYQPALARFEARVPGLGGRQLVNVSATTPGRSPDAIVVLAHRDDTGEGPGANDNASGTGALLELARLYGRFPRPRAVGGSVGAGPAHTIEFVSTDGDAFGGLGTHRFLETQARPGRIVAVVNLTAIAGPGAPGIQFGSNRPRLPPSALVQTAASRTNEQTTESPARPSAFGQLVDLAFPFNLYAHAAFVDEGIPALTLTTSGDRPPAAATDTASDLGTRRIRQVGRSAEALIASLDQALEIGRGTSSYLYFGSRTLRGWAVELALIAALLPFLVASVDLFARCRRRRIPLRPAFQSFRRRAGFWLFLGAAFAVFAAVGDWGEGTPGPPPPGLPETGDWPVLAVAGLGALAFLAWLVARERLLPRRPVELEEELAGATVALVALGIVALVVAAVNPFSLLFVLPSLHAWLWLPQLRHRYPVARTAVFAAGLLGLAVLVGSFAGRYGFGLDAPWYILRLVAAGWVPVPLVLAFLCWCAAAGQLAAISAGRYAPYPARGERPARGLVGIVVRRLVVRSRARRRVRVERSRATGG